MKLQRYVVSITVLLNLAVTCPTIWAGDEAKLAADDPTGTWRWNVKNLAGKVPDITFTFKLHGETLTGTRTTSTGTLAITNGVFKGDEISFQTVRETNVGTLTSTYRGKLIGDILKGKMEVRTDDRSFTADWGAKRVSK